MTRESRALRLGAAISALALLAACDGNPLDLDMRSSFNQFSTAEAARNATIDRPEPDARGIISYPTYQVAVARRNDRVVDVATRIGLPAEDLAGYNGLQTGDTLREGEILALPKRVAEPVTPAGLAPAAAPGGSSDIASIAGRAIDRAGDRRVETTTLSPATPASVSAPAPAPAAPAAREPIRHQVSRGETAYTISRLYGVSVRSLAEWNGLDRDFTVREGQYLMIPVALDAPAPIPAKAAVTEAPGAGTPTPVPPSASAPLPAERTEPVAAAPKPADNPAPDLSSTQTPAKPAAMAWPVQGRIIREYAKGRNEGIDIAADPGTAVGAADAGTVAAITSDAEGNKVVVLRHEGKLLTIYSNVDKIAVTEKQQVSRGQKIAEIRAGSSAYVHFEVRKGLDSTDPMGFLN